MNNKRKNILKHTVCTILILSGIYCMYHLADFMNINADNYHNQAYEVYFQTVVYFLLSASYFIVLLFEDSSIEVKLRKRNRELEREVEIKNKLIKEQNSKMDRCQIYDTTAHSWTREIFQEFITQIFEKNMGNFSVVKLRCNNANDEKIFLRHINYTKGENLILFKITDLDYYIIFIGTDKYEMDLDLKVLLTKSTKIYYENDFDTKINSTFDTLKDIFEN